jgi:hypothetical protein
MCLIVTIIMIVLSIQNLIHAHWFAGGIQLMIALGFSVLILRNIQKTNCEKDSSCNHSCMLTGWIAKIFPKKNKN